VKPEPAPASHLRPWPPPSSVGLGWFRLGASLIPWRCQHHGQRRVADEHLIGDLLASGMTVLMSVMTLIIRQQHENPMLLAACLGSEVSARVWPIAAPFDIATTDLLKPFLLGTCFS
jgi:hypothetical protein